ncbi:hypothetical protein MPH_07552 [Macrophomina phaseolina MS6]|uniref:Uncharacterized protein n=1 Tax=Macrophomina phaseolina (strain MS6) TaxID=1126212 RepID=K2RKL0_MACPH|nr:hypothetical protein MPH_07552 [Macrophomina phaseolina MS6]
MIDGLPSPAQLLSVAREQAVDLPDNEVQQLHHACPMPPWPRFQYRSVWKYSRVEVTVADQLKIFRMQTAGLRSLLEPEYEFEFVEGRWPHLEGNWSLHTVDFSKSKVRRSQYSHCRSIDIDHLEAVWLLQWPRPGRHPADRERVAADHQG